MSNKALIIMTATSLILSITLNVGFDVNFPIFHGFCLSLIIMFSLYYIYWAVYVEMYKQKEMVSLKAKEEECFKQKNYIGAANTVEKIIVIYQEKTKLSKFNFNYYKKMIRLYRNLLDEYKYADFLTKLKEEIKTNKL